MFFFMCIWIMLACFSCLGQGVEQRVVKKFNLATIAPSEGFIKLVLGYVDSKGVFSSIRMEVKNLDTGETFGIRVKKNSKVVLMLRFLAGYYSFDSISLESSTVMSSDSKEIFSKAPKNLFYVSPQKINFLGELRFELNGRTNGKKFDFKNDQKLNLHSLYMCQFFYGYEDFYKQLALSGVQESQIVKKILLWEDSERYRSINLKNKQRYVYKLGRYGYETYGVDPEDFLEHGILWNMSLTDCLARFKQNNNDVFFRVSRGDNVIYPWDSSFPQSFNIHGIEGTHGWSLSKLQEKKVIGVNDILCFKIKNKTYWVRRSFFNKEHSLYLMGEKYVNLKDFQKKIETLNKRYGMGKKQRDFMEWEFPRTVIRACFRMKSVFWLDKKTLILNNKSLNK